MSSLKYYAALLQTVIGVFIKIHATIKEPRCDCRATDTDVIGVSFQACHKNKCADNDTDVIGVRFQACHRNKCADNDTDVIGVSFRHVIEISVQAMIQM